MSRLLTIMTCQWADLDMETMCKKAKEMGYQPSRAGRALAMAKKNVKIAVILQSIQTPFGCKACSRG